MKLTKIFCLALLFIGLSWLTGCGIRITTDLSIEQDFAGSRTIRCAVSHSDILAYFKGDPERIDHIIESNCPDCFSYTRKETGSGHEFIFRLDFQSLEEYRTALASVLSFGPEITFQASDSIFSKGLTLKENFSSLDMLRWFEVLLKEEYSISEEQFASLWEIGDTKVKFLGRDYPSKDSKIHISSMEYADFDGIDIYTTEKDDRSYERLIRFRIPSSTLDKHAAELENFFASRIPQNATAYWIPKKTGKYYELTLYADNFRILSEETATALDCKDHQASVSSDFEDYHFFQYRLERMEQLDFSYFLCTENGEVPVTYYYKPNSMTKVLTDEIQKKINNQFSGDTDKNGFYCIFDSDCTTLNIGFLGQMTVPVSSYKIITALKEKGMLKRQFIFRFPDVLKKNERDRLTSFFEKNNTARLKMSTDFEAGQGTLTIVQSGTKDSLNYSSRLLFGADDNTVEYKKGSFAFTLYQDTSLTETIDLSRFLGDANKKTAGEYRFLQQSGETLKKFSLRSDTSDIDYKDTNQTNSYTAAITGCHFHSSYTGSTFSPLGACTFLLLGACLVGFLWLLIKRNPMKGKGGL